MQPEGESRPDLSTLVRRVVPQELPGLPQPFNAGLEERFQLERNGTPYARFFVQVQPRSGDLARSATRSSSRCHAEWGLR
jgi:hypothetical protein